MNLGTFNHPEKSFTNMCVLIMNDQKPMPQGTTENKIDWSCRGDAQKSTNLQYQYQYWQGWDQKIATNQRVGRAHRSISKN